MAKWTDVLFMILFVSYITASFSIKKVSFVTSDGISHTLWKDVMYEEETFINSSIFLDV